jgi:transcriptional regulator GlxA family with amidase domain
MQIAILLYDRFTALDAVGPYEVLSRLPGAEVTFIAERPGLVRTDTRRLAIDADAALADLPHPEIVLVPGGHGQGALMDDGPVHAWLRAADEQSTWTTSVCTGSLILAAAGLLEGRRATSHWLALEQLRTLGVDAVAERFVFDGKIVTAAGVSAGIDMALALAARIAGEQVAQAIQLGIEYDPDPPFDAGSPATAPESIVEAVLAHSRFVEGAARREETESEGEPLGRSS